MDMYESFEYFSRTFEKNKMTFLVSAVLIVAMIGGYYAYRTYTIATQESASHAFVESMRYYDAKVKTDSKEADDINALVFDTEQEKWEKTATAFQEAYAQHQRAAIAGVFLVYAADALLHLGKNSEARDLMARGVATISDAEMHDWYRAKEALMQLDASEEAVQQKGIATLMLLAQDQKSVANDLALYQLGDYYWYRNDFEKAKSFWNTLDLTYRKTEKPSEWYLLAKPRLKLIQG